MSRRLPSTLSIFQQAWSSGLPATDSTASVEKRLKGVKKHPNPNLAHREKRWRGHLPSNSDPPPSTPCSHHKLWPDMVRRGSDKNRLRHSSRANTARQGTNGQDTHQSGTYSKPSAFAFAPSGQRASGYGAYGLREIARASQHARHTRTTAASRARASTNWNPTGQQDHVDYVQQQEGRQHQGYQRNFEHQPMRGMPNSFFQMPTSNALSEGMPWNWPGAQQYQQQIHLGGFYPTPPNFSNMNQQLPFRPISNHLCTPGPPGLPTPPRTNSSITATNPKKKKKRGSQPTMSSLNPGTNPQTPRERDAIVPPTAASGGVPEPTAAYILRSSFLPRTLPAPQPLLVIIDLNGTLLYRPNSHQQPRRFEARPGAARFLEHAIAKFHVMIWSSARPGNVSAMTDKLFTPSQLKQLVAVWGRDRFGLSPEDYTKRVQCYKRLHRVWADPVVGASYPAGFDDAGLDVDGREEGTWRPGSWNQGNTVLIDDSREKARSEPHNAIEIPEYKGEVEAEPVLERVRAYLDTLAVQADVSTYIRVHPFSLVGK